MAYKFLMALVLIIVLGFLAIPITSMGTEITGVFNGMTSDTDVISYNNMYLNILYIAFPICVIAILLLVLRDDDYMGR